MLDTCYCETTFRRRIKRDGSSSWEITMSVSERVFSTTKPDSTISGQPISQVRNRIQPSGVLAIYYD